MGTECKNIALFLYIIKLLSTQVSDSQHVMLMFVPKGFNWSTRQPIKNHCIAAVARLIWISGVISYAVYRDVVGITSSCLGR